MTTADYLTQLIDSKQDIKSAIEEKGVEVTGGLTTYADLIRMIMSRIDFSPLNYDNNVINIAYNGLQNYVDYGVWVKDNTLRDEPLYVNGSPIYSNLRHNEKLIFAPQIDFSNTPSNVGIGFKDCVNLVALAPPILDEPYIDGFFIGCSSLTAVPLFDTSNVITMSQMFYGCSSLTYVPLFDTSNVIMMNSMFYACSQLTTVPLFNTSKVTNMEQMFNYCTKLTTLPLFDCGNVTNIGMFGYDGSSSIKHLGGFKDQIVIYYHIT